MNDEQFEKMYKEVSKAGKVLDKMWSLIVFWIIASIAGGVIAGLIVAGILTNM